MLLRLKQRRVNDISTLIHVTIILAWKGPEFITRSRPYQSVNNVSSGLFSNLMHCIPILSLQFFVFSFSQMQPKAREDAVPELIKVFKAYL